MVLGDGLTILYGFIHSFIMYTWFSLLSMVLDNYFLWDIVFVHCISIVHCILYFTHGIERSKLL